MKILNEDRIVDIREPSASEYGSFMNDLYNKLSTDYAKVVSNNIDWLGYYITTPYNKYRAYQKGGFPEKRYYLLAPYKGYPVMYDMPFDDIKDIVTYLETNKM